MLDLQFKPLTPLYDVQGMSTENKIKNPTIRLHPRRESAPAASSSNQPATNPRSRTPRTRLSGWSLGRNYSGNPVIQPDYNYCPFESEFDQIRVENSPIPVIPPTRSASTVAVPSSPGDSPKVQTTVQPQGYQLSPGVLDRLVGLFIEEKSIALGERRLRLDRQYLDLHRRHQRAQREARGPQGSELSSPLHRS